MLERISHKFEATLVSLIERYKTNPLSIMDQHKVLQNHCAEAGVSNLHYPARDKTSQALILGFNMGMVAQRLGIPIPLMRGMVEEVAADVDDDDKCEVCGRPATSNYCDADGTYLCKECCAGLKAAEVDTSALDHLADDALLGEELSSVGAPLAGALPNGDENAEGTHKGHPYEETKTPKDETPADPDASPDGVLATGSARMMAEAHGIDLKLVKGTGKFGKVTAGDVNTYRKQREAAGPLLDVGSDPTVGVPLVGTLPHGDENAEGTHKGHPYEEGATV